MFRETTSPVQYFIDDMHCHQFHLAKIIRKCPLRALKESFLSERILHDYAPCTMYIDHYRCKYFPLVLAYLLSIFSRDVTFLRDGDVGTGHYNPCVPG